MCECGAEVETTEHFLWRCRFYSSQRSKLFNYLEKPNSNFTNLSDKSHLCFMVQKQIFLRTLIKILSKL